MTEYADPIKDDIRKYSVIYYIARLPEIQLVARQLVRC